MNRLYNFLLMLLALLLPATATADRFEVDGIYYYFDGYSVYVTSGGNYAGDVIIPETVDYDGVIYPVKGIENDAFYNCKYMTSVVIPDSVTYIGNSAFYNCSGLISVTIGKSVGYIGDKAFQGCVSLRTLNFNAVSCSDFSSVYNNRPFYKLDISTINIGDSVQVIPAYFAVGLKYLTNIEIPHSVTLIGDNAFSDCSGLTNFNLSNSVTKIGDHAFSYCTGLTNVIIPNSVTDIGDYVFSYCSNLSSIAIPNSVTSIGTNAFMSTSWYDNQPDGLVYAGLVAYVYKGQMPEGLSITLEDGTLGIASSAFNGRSSLTNIIIPNTVKCIGSRAFRKCSGLTNVTIGNSVTCIGDEAFRYCTGLTNVNIPDSVLTIGNYAFHQCSELTSVTIGKSVMNIGSEAFYECNGLTDLIWNAKNCSSKGSMTTNNIISVTIGQEVGSIPLGFVSGSKITEVLIPNSVTTICGSSFYNCSRLTNITIPNSVTSIDSNAFGCCSGLKSISVESGNTIYDSRDNCNAIIETASNTLVTGCQNTIIPNSVTSIGDYAFRGSGLTSIAIPNSISSINYYAFAECTRLKDVYCHINDPAGVSLGSSAFYLQDTWRYALRTLHVPVGSLADYQASDWYNYFGSFVEMDEGGKVTAIELDKQAAVVIVGETLQLTAIITPEDATNKTVNWASSNPNVATVDENGFVTACSLGTTTITAVTTDGSNLSASCMVTVKCLSADNCFFLPDTTVFHGELVTIPVRLTNDQDILAFQTKIYLPEGFTMATDENNEIVITPSYRLTDDHILMANENDGVVSVVCYTPEGQPIGGNSGDDLFYITVQVPEDASGNYAIYLRNSRLTTAEYTELRIPDAGAVLKVMSYIPGDANDSHSVTVTDIVVTAQYLLGRNPSPFIFEAADMNGDGEVTVTDIMLIAYLINHPTMNAPKRMPALEGGNDSMSGEDVTLMAGETRKVSIQLNNEMDYTAFQLDLTLPAGLMASNFQLTDRAGSHAFDVNTLSSGKTRALCYSPAIEVINGHEGALLTFDVTATDDIEGIITVDGIELVTADCQTVLMNSFTIGVNSTTSVNELNGVKTVARVDYFNLAGQQIDRPGSGVTLVVTTYSDGTRSTTKVIK